MHIRSLTLRGFKSFADTTELLLEPGVTVVVGPNGSGKSNVVDALAWVLGAQGPRTLRSARMDDVIFAGTDTRPQLGRAEVTLVLDNADGQLAADGAEVAITRRLFRSGESEYLLNGQPCRLGDLTELLSDAGVGRSRHVIVAQGQIDEVLAATPEARRAIVEEAAGVLTLRRNKERAERRLAATDANYARLTDLQRELKRQLRPLRRQADAARRSQQVESQLAELELFLAGEELRNLSAAAERAERAQAELAARTAAASDELTQLDASLERVRADLSSLAADDNSLLTRAAALVERAYGLKRLTAARIEANERAEQLVLADDVVANHTAELRRLDQQDAQLAETQRQLRPVEPDVVTAPQPVAPFTPTAAQRAAAEATEGVAGVMGPVASLLSVESGYDGALHAALGPALGQVVVDSPAAARRAIEALREAEVGGEVLVASAAQLSPAVAAHPALPEAQLLAPHVTATDPRVARLVSELLADAYLVNDLDAGTAAAAQHPNATFVTRHGTSVGPLRWRQLGGTQPAEPAEQAAEAARRAERGRQLERQRAALAERRATLEHTISQHRSRAAAADAALARHEAIRSGLTSLSAWLLRVTRSAEDRLRLLREQNAHRADTLAELERTQQQLQRDRSQREAELRSLAEHQARQASDEAVRNDRTQATHDRIRTQLESTVEQALAQPAPELPEGATAREQRRALQAELKRLGPINALALSEYDELAQRHDENAEQLDDVLSTRRELGKLIRTIDAEITATFDAAFADVQRNFANTFEHLFPGGTGSLRLTEPDDLLATGIELSAQPHRKRVEHLSLLSGGERSLTALAFLFAVFASRPSPFYILDEVEAALDDVNLNRFLRLLETLGSGAQLVIISHQQRTMEVADVLYGVSMPPGGSSMVVADRRRDRAAALTGAGRP